MFIVLRFHSLVDYLTSFSGVDLSSLMFLWRCFFFLLPSWQVDVQIVLFLVDMFAQIELLLLSRNSYFYIHFCTLKVVMCIFYIFFFSNYLQHKLKKKTLLLLVLFCQYNRGRCYVRYCIGWIFMHFQERVLCGGGDVSSICSSWVYCLLTGVLFVCARGWKVN